VVNVAGALDTLGRGLGAFAIRRDEREQKELEDMRREALARLQMQHETELSEKQQKHQTDLFERGQAAAAESQARELAWRSGERAASEEGADRRLSRQLSATREAELRRGREDIRQQYTRLITSTDSRMKGLQDKMAELKGTGSLTPEGEQLYAAQLAQLQQERLNYQRSMVYDLQRVDAGGYGAGLTEDQVRAMRDSGGTTAVGAKGPRNDDLFGPSVGGSSGAKSMTAQALGMQPMDSLQGQGSPGMQPSAPAAPSMAGASQMPAGPPTATMGASGLGGSVPPVPPGAPPVDTMAGLGGSVPPPPAGAAPAAADTTAGLGGSVPPPPADDLFPQRAAPPPTPIQRHAQGYRDAAVLALQLIRAGKPVDPATKFQAKQVGFGTLARQYGWSQSELSALGF